MRAAYRWVSPGWGFEAKSENTERGCHETYPDA